MTKEEKQALTAAAQEHINSYDQKYQTLLRVYDNIIPFLLHYFNLSANLQLSFVTIKENFKYLTLT